MASSKRSDPEAFEPQGMVRWLAPRTLVASAKEVVLSGLFADFADKREVQASVSQGIFDYHGEEEFWVDYVADVGDGYATTATVARLLALSELKVGGRPTQRGRVLILGGDQVYPSPDWDAYHDRFVGPYREALPTSADPRPEMFALPGNHDWYDGLTSFTRLFCQPPGFGEVGAWRTPQRRSYFALRLPHDWWLWAIDSQFDRYIDGPQLEYFLDVASKTGPNHRVILATAKPSWVHVGEPNEVRQRWETLAFFEHEVVRLKGARLALTITGDLHHYAHYVEKSSGGIRQHKITSGGGGAYLSATHWLPTGLTLPPHRPASRPTDAADGHVHYKLQHRWPRCRPTVRVKTLGRSSAWCPS